MTNRAAPTAKKGRRGKFNPRLCNSCQEYHPFGKHTKTKQEAQDLVNRQLRGLAPIPQFAAVQAAKDELREYKIANLRRGQLSDDDLIRQYDQRRADQRECERTLVGHAPAMFAHMVQQQGPEAGYTFLAGLYNGTVTQFPTQLQYPIPTYGYQAQPQRPMPTYGYPAPTYPASAYPNAQHQAPQAAHVQDTTPQPPMPFAATAYGVPPNTPYDVRPTAPPAATKAPARGPRDATERREPRTPKDKA